MKKLYLFFAAGMLFAALATPAQAQQIPLYSQYFHNPLIYNPAWAGLDKFGSLNITHRRQWEQIEGGPVTNLITFDMPFYEDRVGLGVNIMQERIGLFQQNRFYFSYAYHIFQLVENSSYLSFGLTGGVISNRIDFTNAYILHPTDPRIVDNTGNYTGLEFNFGMNYIYQDKFQIGFSLPQLVTTGIRSIDQGDNNIRLRPHYMLAARCTLKTADEIHRVEPMLMLRKFSNIPLQFDIGAQYIWNDLLWFNLAYRTDYSTVIGAGISLNRLRAGYARDFATSDLAGVAGSSNEIMLGYKFNQLRTRTYGAQKGSSNTNIRRKVAHPSKAGPVIFKPKNVHLKGNSKKKPNVKLKPRRRY